MLADLYEDLAAEQKARLTYDNILRLADDPDVLDVIKFLREREIVHFQRFGEANRAVYIKIRGPEKAPYRFHKISTLSIWIKTFWMSASATNLRSSNSIRAHNAACSRMIGRD